MSSAEQTSEEKIKKKICTFLLEAHKNNRLLKNSDPVESQNLYNDAWLDSILSLKLLTNLEETYAIRISAFALTQKNFATIQSITNLILNTLKK